MWGGPMWSPATRRAGSARRSREEESMRDVAVIGVGASDTNNRVEEAVTGALSNPLLDVSYEGATGAIIHVHGGPDMTLDEISRVGEMVTESMDEDANVIWGAP